MPIPTAVLRSLFSRRSGDPLIYLLTIDHASFGAPYRFCTNATGHDVVSNGNTFKAAPFTLYWPDESDEIPSAQLVAVNVDREIGLALEAINGACSAQIEVVMASDPDTVWKTAQDFELRGCKWNAMTLEAIITREPIHTEPIPWVSATPRLFPTIHP
jgi:hypothetical protein